MKKIAFINQRYGLEVNGGSEYYTREIVEHLAGNYDITVLTTCAINHVTWKNEYKAGDDYVNGILVKRFHIKKKRGRIPLRVLEEIRRKIGKIPYFLENYWLKEQGPYCPEMIEYIENHQNDYDVFVFVTYLYYPTAAGVCKVRDRAIVVPTAHDEPSIYMRLYKPVFECPRGIVYLTEEEKEFVENNFRVKEKHNIVAGVGVDLPETVNSDEFRLKYNIKGKYLIYVGRVEELKGCRMMFEYFKTLQHQYSDLELVIMGQSNLAIPEDERIHYLGFVSEQDKYNGIFGALALWLPSKYESLSIVVLEAMSLGTPVIVNGLCNVLKGHCVKSKGGIYYTDYEEFIRGLDEVIEHADELGKNGKAYIDNFYHWNKVVSDYKMIIEEVSER